MNPIEQLRRQIETLRAELNELLSEGTSLCAGIMLEKSQLLDNLLNKYQHMKKPVA